MQAFNRFDFWSSNNKIVPQEYGQDLGCSIKASQLWMEFVEIRL